MLKDLKRTLAMPYIVNPEFISGVPSFDHYCRRKEVELLEMELNNALFKLHRYKIMLERTERAAEIYRKKAYEFATSTSAENLESERQANYILTEENEALLTEIEDLKRKLKEKEK